LTAKEEKFFKKDKWYHGTTLAEWKALCNSRVLASYNIGTSLDYGNGFYLSPSEEDTKKYALDTVRYNGSDIPDDNVPVVIEFSYVPLDDILSDTDYKYFSKYNDEFANFVFECRCNYASLKKHPYKITGGVMTDTIPTKLMQEYFAGLKTKESVIEEFKKSTSKKQLCLHTQELCDKLKLVRAYVVDGKELDVDEYGKK
jgi:hypothetical protein